VAVVTSMDLVELVRDRLESANPDVLKALVEAFANTLMSAEADAICGAAWGQVSPDRVNRRNGYRDRDWDTRAGTVELKIPKLREGSYFPDFLLERRRRAEKALTTVVATCYLLGVSTRRVERLAEAMGITTLSKSQVSQMARQLDEMVDDLANRPLDRGPYRFCWADALEIKVREGGRTVGVHVLIATGVGAEGHREILGVEVTTAEDGAGWLAFFRGLVARGLSGVELITSDAHPGLVGAIRATLPGAAWQRCRTHYLRDLLTKVNKSSQPWVATLVRTIFDQPDAEEVAAQFERVRAGLEAKLPQAAAHLDAARDDLVALECLPEGDMAPDMELQPPTTLEPGDPPAHRRRRHLPRPHLDHPPRRCRLGRTKRRVDRIPPLHGARDPRQGGHRPQRRQAAEACRLRARRTRQSN
jgi:putative transposase